MCVMRVSFDTSRISCLVRAGCVSSRADRGYARGRKRTNAEQDKNVGAIESSRRGWVATSGTFGNPPGEMVVKGKGVRQWVLLDDSLTAQCVGEIRTATRPHRTNESDVSLPEC